MCVCVAAALSTPSQVLEYIHFWRDKSLFVCFIYLFIIFWDSNTCDPTTVIYNRLTALLIFWKIKVHVLGQEISPRRTVAGVGNPQNFPNAEVKILCMFK